MMTPMASIRPKVAQRAAECGNRLLRPSIRAITTVRNITTDATVQEPAGDFPGGFPSLPGAHRKSVVERKEAIRNAKPFSEFLTDSFQRQHDYLRISVTERCNLRCLYCMPEEGIQLSPPSHLLTTPEIFYLSSLFVSQGVTKIRLTGGEPTVRRDIVPLMQSIGSLRSKGLKELALTTNGITLYRKLDSMVEAGLTGVNLSLDTLDPFQFQIMTRRNGFDAVMKCINRILEMNKLGANVKLKVNCVVMRGLNERDIIPFVEMGREKDIEVRFIEYMPFGGNKWSEGKMISYQEMLDIIRVKYPDLRRVPGHKNDTSKTFEVPGFVGRVGFITSMTNDFCGTCNRLRITSDGNLKVCLHGNAEVSLRDLLRQDNDGQPIDQEAFERIKQIEMDRRDGRLSDETILGWGQREKALLEVIGAAVKRKAEKHADIGDLENMENRPMILIDPSRHTEPVPTTSRTMKSLAFPASGSGLTRQWSTIPPPHLPFLYPPFRPSPGTFARAFSTTPRAGKSSRRGGNSAAENDARYEARRRMETRRMLAALREGKPVPQTPTWYKRWMKNESERQLKEERGVAARDTMGDPNESAAAVSRPLERKTSSDAHTLHQYVNNRIVKALQKRIDELEARIAAEKLYLPDEDPGEFDSFAKIEGLSKLSRRTRRMLWRKRREAASLLRRSYAASKKIAADSSATAEMEKAAQKIAKKHRYDIVQLESSLTELQLALEDVKPQDAQSLTSSQKAEDADVSRSTIEEAPESKLARQPRKARKHHLATVKKQTEAPPLVIRQRATPIQKKDLRTDISTDILHVIDDELTIDFYSDTVELQAQLYQLQDRLKTAYPQIDTFPYHVWTSTNEDSLRLWLKILLRKWYDRDASKGVDTDDMFAQVCDRLVNDHGLSFEQATPLAKRFVDAFRDRKNTNLDIDQELNREQLDAGFGWLSSETSDADAKQNDTQEKSKSGESQYRLPGTWTTQRGRGSTRKYRQYSTSAHPPLPPRETTRDPDIIPDQTDPVASVQSPNALPHLTPSGSAHMVSVSAKAHTVRTAVAVGIVHFSNATPLSLIRSNSLKKGDVLSVARIAGIMAAKNCPSLIPLCHPIALSHVGVVLRVFDNPSASPATEAKQQSGHGGVEIQARVQCTGPTGVEMEALTAVMGAALTVVDMCKAVDKGMRVQDVRVVLKEGGRSGVWREEGWEEMCD